MLITFVIALAGLKSLVSTPVFEPRYFFVIYPAIILMFLLMIKDLGKSHYFYYGIIFVLVLNTTVFLDDFLENSEWTHRRLGADAEEFSCG